MHGPIRRTALPRLALAGMIALLGATAAVAAAPAGGGDAPVAKPAAPEEPPQIVRAIALRGNQNVGNEQILAAVTHTRIGEPLDKEDVQKDLQDISDMGYFQDVGAQVSGMPGGVRLTFVIDELPILERIEIETPVLTPEKLRPYFSAKEGEILNLKDLYADATALRQRLMDAEGYVLRVDDVAVGDSGVVRIRLKEARVDAVEIEGNQKTQEFVIRREMKLETGDILDVNRLRSDLRQLMQLGYFDSVTPVFVDTADPDRVKLVIKVDERRTGAATFGAGYSSADGFLGYIDVSDENFLGRGQKTNIRWEFGKNSNTYDLGFFEPYLTRSGTSLGFNLFRRSADREQVEDGKAERYNEFRLGGDVSLGQRLTNFTQVFATYRLENVKVTPEASAGAIVPSDNRLRTLKLSTRTNTTDSPFYPTTGFKSGLSAETAGTWLGGNVEFTKYQGDYSRYFRVGSSNQTVALRVAAGGSDRSLPFEEEFRLGGAETVRGYQYGEMHGDSMAMANVEYRFPIVKLVQGVLFADFGNAWEKPETIRMDELKRAYGVGVRFQTPLGVIRIDYGIGEKGGNAYFSLGPTF